MALEFKYLPSITKDINKPNSLIMLMGNFYLKDNGGALANYGYFYPLSKITNLDVLYITWIETKTPVTSKDPLLTDMNFNYGVVFDPKIYNIINQYNYEYIFTTLNFDFNFITAPSKFIKLSYDLYSNFLKSHPKYLNEIPLIKQWENEVYSNYYKVISCSPIDSKSNPNLSYIPYYFKFNLTQYSNNQGILLEGSGDWDRFIKSHKFLNKYKDRINSQINVYSPKIDSNKTPLISGVNYLKGDLDRSFYSYSIQPIEYPSGIPSKVLNSLSHGLPVITTQKCKNEFFKEYRHVYGFNNIEDINHIITQDVRSNPNTLKEIEEDMEKFHGVNKVIQDLLGVL